MLQANEILNYGSNFNLHADDRHPAFKKIITRNPRMGQIFKIIGKVAVSNGTVLVTGESGTGKELIAQAIHEISGVPGAFVPVNCGAIPENLLESELFGYEKGAFTGAANSKLGRFVLADNGTIFLDEIGDMPLQLQVKLLRFLQEKTVEPVGGVKSKTVSVRIIAATNKDLKELVKIGKFREDLYYRLNVVPIDLPNLKERQDDIEVLVQYFSEKFAKEYSRRPLVFSPDALWVMRYYSWPGNIRELGSLIENLSILTDSDAVYANDLPEHINSTTPRSLSSQIECVMTKLPDNGVDFNDLVDSFENNLIIQALERTSWNKKAAAKLLNLNRTTLVEKIKKKGLEVKKDPEDELLN
ncbi:MAG: sigma-54 dependent transcriptional regulator [Deltaproteobacteria bacterium]|jgi:transcriptional regulator with GAF, ATPase, and Fis domain|nr:sigma-54 dependent transcriptional regulator [Deltaproteobacteria bacterium]